jgi:1-acyl-sn-glycerol-3-phosphate acyltransferase
MDMESPIPRPADCRRWGEDPTLIDPDYVRRLLRRMGLLFGDRRYFRVDAQGWENLPEPPVLLVSNHSGGTLILDAWGLWYAWNHHFGSDRIVHALGHNLLFSNPAIGRAFAHMGIVRASRTIGREILGTWKRDLTVMPGGDKDAWRPFSQRYKVNFAGRTGYAKLALEMGVPVVPVAHAGAQSSLVVLNDGTPIARALKFHQLVRAEIYPLHLSLPWGVAFGPWPHLPLPVTLRYRFGAPIQPPAVSGPDGPTDGQVRDLDARVRASMQGLLDGLAEGSVTSRLRRKVGLSSSRGA